QKWGVKEHCEARGMTPRRLLRSLRGTVAYLGTVKPELAEEYTIALKAIAATIEESMEEQTLQLLKQIIDKEQVASFKYSDHRYYEAAPSAITVDPENTLLVRAFQLKPEQGWKYFLISKIKDLRTTTTAS